MRGLNVFVNVGAKLLPSLGQVARATEARFDQTARRLRLMNAEARAGWRGMRNDVSTFGTHVSTSAGILTGLGARAAYQWSKVGNELQAVTQMSDSARKKIEAVARAMPGNPTDNLTAALDLARTGFDAKAIMGSLPVTIKLGMADSSVDQAEAADILTNVMKGMKMPEKTLADVTRSANRVANNIAFGAARSSSNIHLMGESFKYAAPLAARVGIAIEDVTAYMMTMADAGIKGSESGVAFRSGMVRLLKPTKGAMAVLAKYNMTLDDYVSGGKRATGTSIVDSLRAQGIAADGAAATIQSLLNNDNLSGAALTQKITQAVADGMEGGADATDLDKLSEMVTNALTSGADKVDFAKFIADAQAKGWSTGDLVHFFDVRQGARLSTLFGPDFERNLKALKAAVRIEEGRGTFLDSMWAAQMKGAVGQWEHMKQGAGNAVIAMAESGVMDTVANGLNAIANGLMNLSRSSPGLLKLITYSIMGVAVLAPLGFALAGLAAGLRLLALPLRLIMPAWRGLFSAVGAAGPRIPLILRLGRALGGLGRVALGARVGLMMLARLGFVALLTAAAPAALAILAIGTAIAFVVSKWNGIKAFFAGFADGFRKAVPPEAREQFAKVGGWIASLGVVFKPVISLVRKFGAVVSWAFGWLGKLFAPAEVGRWRSWGETAGGAIGGVVRWLASLIGKIEAVIGKVRQLTSMKLAPDSGIGQVLNGAARGFATGGFAGAIVGTGQALAGKRASGGSVASGKPYLIGERGPEIMVPGRSGTVVPAHVLNALRRIGAPPALANDNMPRPGRAAALFLAMATPAAASTPGSPPTDVAGAMAPARSTTAPASIEVTINVSGASDPHAVALEVRRVFREEMRKLANGHRGTLSD